MCFMILNQNWLQSITTRKGPKMGRLRCSDSCRSCPLSLHRKYRSSKIWFSTSLLFNRRSLSVSSTWKFAKNMIYVLGFCWFWLQNCINKIFDGDRGATQQKNQLIGEKNILRCSNNDLSLFWSVQEHLFLVALENAMPLIRLLVAGIKKRMRAQQK